MKTPVRFNRLPSFAAIIAALFAGAVSTNDAPVCALLLGEAAAVAALRALLAVVVLLAVAGVVATGCPRLPPVSGCNPMAQACIADRPHVCSASQRWQPAGDLACATVGGVCAVASGRAYCAPRTDGGAR